MNAIQLKNALNEVLGKHHNDDHCAFVIRDTIITWYYTTYITAEECVDLLEEYLTKGQMTLTGKFDKKF
jgi:hypothetical protein